MTVAMVTGASRGIGRGVAEALDGAGYSVFATGRRVSDADLPPGVTRIPCDHRHDEQTAKAFAALGDAPLDILAACAWGGYERMVEAGRFSWGDPFWEQPAHRWEGMFDAGVRAAFVSCAHAARLMVPRRRGLIVNIGFWSASHYVGNTIYGAAKAAVDKMTADMAHELAPHGVSVVSLYPGLVRTESVLDAAAAGAFDLAGSESPQFIGRVIAALAADPHLSERSGQVVVAAQAARRRRHRWRPAQAPDRPIALRRLTWPGRPPTFASGLLREGGEPPAAA